MWFTQSNPTRLTPTSDLTVNMNQSYLNMNQLEYLLAQLGLKVKRGVFEPIKTQTCLIILNK